MDQPITLIGKTKNLEENVANQKKEIETAVTLGEQTEKRVRVLNDASNQLALISTRITYLQLETKSEFGTDRAQKAMEKIFTDLNTVAMLVIPDMSKRNEWISKLQSELPPRK